MTIISVLYHLCEEKGELNISIGSLATTRPAGVTGTTVKGNKKSGVKQSL